MAAPLVSDVARRLHGSFSICAHYILGHEAEKLPPSLQEYLSELTELQPIDLILTEEELPTFKDLMAFLHQHSTLSSVPVVIINPDAEDGARLGDAYLLADYDDISSFLSVLTAECTNGSASRLFTKA
jgi:hypothetical protein